MVHGKKVICQCLTILIIILLGNITENKGEYLTSLRLAHVVSLKVRLTFS